MPRQLASNGLATIYSDESDDQHVYVMSAVSIPTLSPNEGNLEIAWDHYFDQTK